MRFWLIVKKASSEFALETMAETFRGELVIGVPVGLIKEWDSYEKNPGRRVQKVFTLVFDKVLELGRAR